MFQFFAIIFITKSKITENFLTRQNLLSETTPEVYDRVKIFSRKVDHRKNKQKSHIIKYIIHQYICLCSKIIRIALYW